MKIQLKQGDMTEGDPVMTLDWVVRNITEQVTFNLIFEDQKEHTWYFQKGLYKQKE